MFSWEVTWQNLRFSLFIFAAIGGLIFKYVGQEDWSINQVQCSCFPSLGWSHILHVVLPLATLLRYFYSSNLFGIMAEDHARTVSLKWPSFKALCFNQKCQSWIQSLQRPFTLQSSPWQRWVSETSLQWQQVASVALFSWLWFNIHMHFGFLNSLYLFTLGVLSHLLQTWQAKLHWTFSKALTRLAKAFCDSFHLAVDHTPGGSFWLYQCWGPNPNLIQLVSDQHYTQVYIHTYTLAFQRRFKKQAFR